MHALGGQAPRHGEADARAAAGDDGDLVSQPEFHDASQGVVPPWCRAGGGTAPIMRQAPGVRLGHLHGTGRSPAVPATGRHPVAPAGSDASAPPRPGSPAEGRAWGFRGVAGIVGGLSIC
ncbi:hypothetical protein GCM10010517_47150 [Streptosporangium fragile]|uniref:Uncharacterized protein n=1 Tax=Streptosporangium fragile TaxID=46186 RepID=A0ABP6IK82_9ACTN